MHLDGTDIPHPPWATLSTSRTIHGHVLRHPRKRIFGARARSVGGKRIGTVRSDTAHLWWKAVPSFIQGRWIRSGETQNGPPEITEAGRPVVCDHSSANDPSVKRSLTL